jgi:chaperone required for assembly of F1-ATPase
MKKFYKVAEAVKDGSAYSIVLDGRPVKTPAQKPLIVYCEKLAQAMAEEWQNCGEDIDPARMPLNQIQTTILDLAEQKKADMAREAQDYLPTDLLFYQADEERYAAIQKQRWHKALEWLEATTGVAPVITTSLTEAKQSPVMAAKLRAYVDSLDLPRLTLLYLVTIESGSVVLAWGFMRGALSADEVLAAVRAEDDVKAEIYQAEKYGLSPSEEKKLQSLQAFLNAAQFYKACL